MQDLFNLDFSRWEVILLSLVPAFINLAIFLYVTFSLPQGRTNNSFSIFVFLLGVWQIGDGFVKMSPTADIALEWYRISGITISFIISFGILFVLRFAKWNKKMSDNLKFALLFLPAILCTFIIVAHLDTYTAVQSHYWYWLVNPEPTLITSIIYLWLSLGGLTMLALLFTFYINTKGNEIKRKQSLLLAIGFSVPVIGGIILEVIPPLLFDKNVVPITNPLMTAFSIASLIAIKKYKMLEYSPKHQWNNIMESLNEGVVIVNDEDHIMYANKMFCKLLGYEFGEINNRRATRLLFDKEDDLEKIRTVNRERKKKISSQYEIQIKKKSGEKIWVMASGSPYLDRKGNVTGSIAILTNINTLKQTENLLLHKEENLLHTVDKLKQITGDLKQAQAIANVGNWEVDFATGKSIWSEEACRMYGIPPEEGHNQSVASWLTFIHPDDLNAVNKEMEKSNTTLSDSSFYHRILWKNETVRHIHSVSKFKFNTEGKPIGIYGICHDITELKKIEEKLKTTNKELKTFIYKSSHDLRAPLASVLGLVSVANMEITELKALNYLNSIGELCLKLDTILIKLVKVMPFKDKEFHIEPVDTGKLLDEILYSLKNIDGFEKIRFNINNQLTAPIQTNRDSIHSIILNLTENAIKYRKQNFPNNEININLLNEKNNTVIEIADNGMGILEEAKYKVFDMFYRASNESKGSGLGLYLVKITVEKLGGHIHLESKETVGTKFTVTLPSKMKN